MMRLGRKNRPIIGKRAVRASRSTALRKIASVSSTRKTAVKANRTRGVKRPVMGGPGGGITIKLKSIDFQDIPNGGFYPEYNRYHDFLEPENGFCRGTVEFASIGTYYYGGDPGLGDVPVDIQVVSAEPNSDEDVQDIVDASLKDVIYDISDIEEVRLGGGYTRTNFTGEFEAEVYCSGYYCTLKLKIRIPDKNLVEWMNDFAHGDNEVIEYDLIINGDPVGNPTENEEEAIELAKRTAEDYDPEETEVGVIMNHYTYGYDGDIDQYFDDDGDVIWRNNDYLYD
jgi:hypothetical protein